MGNFNLNTIRTWNKLYLRGTVSTVDGDSQKSKPISFEAYCKDPIRLNTSIKIDNGNSNAAGMLNTVLSLLGTTSALDIPRKYSFRGTDPLSFSQQCYLVLEDSVEQDFVHWFDNLIKLYLPKSVNTFKETAPAGLSDVAKFVDDAFSALGDGFSDLTGLITSFISKDLSQWSTRSLTELRKGIRYLKIPDALSPVDFNESQSLTFERGAIKISGLFIKSVSITIPELLYEGGYPPYIGLNITFESFRPASDRSFTDFFKGQVKPLPNLK